MAAYPRRVRTTLIALGLVGLGLVGACRGDRRDRDRAPIAPRALAAPPPVDAGLPPTAWAARCRDALLAAREAASRVEPVLATMAIQHERRPDREEVSAHAYPPTWDVAPIHVFAVRPADRPATSDRWQSFATVELGSDHRTAQRTVGDVAVAILADGWQPVAIDAVLAAMQPYLEPCFAP